MKRKLDKATLIGFLVAFGGICGSIVIDGGSLFAYINLSAGMVVFGGTIGVGFVSFPLAVVKRVPKLIGIAFKEPVTDAGPIVQQFVHLAGRARKEGLLALEQEVAGLDHELLKKGIGLVVDGTDPEVVKSVLEIEVAAREARHEVGINLFEALGGYAPTLGILGTVLGLIRYLAHISQATSWRRPSRSPSRPTLYGVGSANLLWLAGGHQAEAAIGGGGGARFPDYRRRRGHSERRQSADRRGQAVGVSRAGQR